LELPLVTPTQKVGNFLGAPASVLASDSTYALNKGLAINHTAIAGIVPVFNQLDVERLFSGELYYYQPTGGIFRNFKHSTEFLYAAAGLLTATSSVGSDSYTSLVDLFFNLETPQITSRFCGDFSMYNWGQNIWSFYMMQPACRTSDTVTHISDTTSYFLGKLLAISTLRDQEILRLLRSTNNYAGGESSSYFLSLSSNKLRWTLGELFSTSSAMGGNNTPSLDILTSLTSGGSFSGFNFSDVIALFSKGLLSSKNRSAYEVVRCEVGSMRRLRVTKGVCLPVDYPIHVICGSKDVIHSWAIPGLGVKIDCIPGYNSHRRVMFRWRGIYWGQCMEVCGRYHHWMPILIRVVHRDVFLS
jgi:hypothetical protein